MKEKDFANVAEQNQSKGVRSNQVSSQAVKINCDIC